MVIQSICSIITAFSTIIISIQLVLMMSIDKKQHEEIRRVKTIDIMQNWSKSLKKETSFAVKVVARFSSEQCRALYVGDEVVLDKKMGKEICQICPYNKGECKACMAGQKFRLNGAQLSEFRWYVITYLNMLETVMTAWNLQIVDRGVIEAQFQYLYNPEKGGDALSAFRMIAGGKKSYPNTEEFIQLMKKREEKGKEFNKL